MTNLFSRTSFPTLFTIGALLAAGAVSTPSFAGAPTAIGINFVGSEPANGTLAGGDLAGVSGGANPDLRQGNWNNYTAGDGSQGSLVDATGATTAADVTVSGIAGLYRSPIGNTTADSRLMKGYLDTGNTSTTTVTVTSIPYAQYQVVVYFDGDNNDNGPSDRIARFEIGGTTIFGRDAAGADFAGTYTPIPPSSTTDLGASTPAGNYLVFTGLTASSFTLTATPGAIVTGEYARAPINAVQILEGAPAPVELLEVSVD